MTEIDIEEVRLRTVALFVGVAPGSSPALFGTAMVAGSPDLIRVGKGRIFSRMFGSDTNYLRVRIPEASNVILTTQTDRQ